MSYWTSGNDLVKEGHWVWANNAEMSYNGNYNGCHHCENSPMPCTEIFKLLKLKIFLYTFLDIFLIFAAKHRLWVHVRTASARRF